MNSLLWHLLAALGEIAGCFAFWAWLRLGKSPFWTLPGILSLAMFAWALTRVDSVAAGRAYAAYGGIYILSSLAWLWIVEKTPPDRGDVLGASVCLIGAADSVRPQTTGLPYRPAPQSNAITDVSV